MEYRRDRIQPPLLNNIINLIHIKMKNLVSLAVCLLIFSIGYAQQKVEYTDFTIVENPKAKYEGIYKNGKPFSGYFKAEEYIDRAPFIDYYENGDRKFRYHFDYLKGETYHDEYYYDTKTEYENGKIKNGFEIKNKGKALALTEYKDFKRTKVHIDVFAMHYFNRITFAMQDNILKISEYRNRDWRLDVKKEKNQPYETIVYHKDKIFYQGKSKGIQEVNEESPNSITYYYKNIKTNQLEVKTYKQEKLNEEDQEKIRELYRNSKILGEILYSFLIKEEDNKEDILEVIYYNIQELNFTEIGSFGNLLVKKNPDILEITNLIYDEKGDIEHGGRITPNSNGTYKLEVFGKEKKEYPNLSLDEIKAIIKKGIVVG